MTSIRPQPIGPDAAGVGPFIDGRFLPAEGATILDSLDKASGEVLGRVAVSTPDDVTRAIAAARAAQPGWASLPPVRRGEFILLMRDALQERAEEFIAMLQRETGSIRGKAAFEVNLALGQLEYAAGLATRSITEQPASISPRRTNMVERVPLGVVALITPWNLPLSLAISPLAPALALGNTVVMKPASHTPLIGGLMIAELAIAAGLPAGVLNVVVGDGDVGKLLAGHSDIDLVRFTGSTAVGRTIAQAAGASLTRVSLELGGNAALVILEDADLDQASMIGAHSSFHFQGQSCIAAGRHIVVGAVADDYVTRLATRAAGLEAGDPFLNDVDLGPMIDEIQVRRAHQLLDDSVAMGAKIVVGGKSNGKYFEPTVVTGVTPEMPLFFEEVFAPIAPVTVAADEDEALELANHTIYGLSNAVVSADTWRGLSFARRMESGMVHVNDTTALNEPSVPFGGWGASSLGVPTGGEASIEQFTKRRWISVQDGPVAYRY